MKNVVKLFGNLNRDRRSKVPLVIIALIAVIGFSITACGDSGGSSDPVDVNLKLPSIASVPNFEGNFVSSETEALALVEDAIEALGDFTGLLSGGSSDADYSKYSIPRGISRAAYNESINESFKNERVAEGVVANGFITGYMKGQIANENSNYGTVGDYQEVSLKAKLSVDFDDITHRYYGSDYKFSGKYIFDEDIYAKMTLTSVYPDERMTIKGNLKAKNGYALSVSKAGKGLKFIMTLEASANVNKTNVSSEDVENVLSVKLTIDVYDNANVKQHSKVFNNIDDAEDFLGDNIIFGF